jgi:hypothetical protein
MGNYVELVALAMNADDENSYLHERNAELLAALAEVEVIISTFYTATTTNALGRDQNRERKQHALTVIRAAIAKAKGE